MDTGAGFERLVAILQDSQGVMWFGTEHGLNSYNGYEFQHYKRERGNPATLGSDFVYDLAAARSRPWVAVTFRNQSFSVISLEDGEVIAEGSTAARGSITPTGSLRCT